MHIHFIAIGGSAMHNLALALYNKGEYITGSDDAVFEPSKSRLEAKGILPAAMGWFPEKITEEIDVIILGMHAKADNPELLRAQELGLTIYSYPEFIYEHAKNKTRVVIGGSHGKTTITSMILHVLHYHGKEVDFLVGAQLTGFDTMVQLTDESDFMLIEGDEYLSSATDLRPKFHLYQPNIALISGIAWDHINVFPTFENYVDQFRIFIHKITNGGILVYNEEDAVVNQLVQETEMPIRKLPYHKPESHIENGITYIETADGSMPLEIFGDHNLSNLAGAKWVCQNMGIDEDDFYEAIATFKGAAKRLEKIAETAAAVAYKDFAHSPSKVKATTEAVKLQYPGKKLVACLELHTYSSLNADFLGEYEGALNAADTALVFYSPDALAIKRMAPISKEDIAKAFNKTNLLVYTQPDDFQAFLKETDFTDSVLLLMSSGNYGGLNFDQVQDLL